MSKRLKFLFYRIDPSYDQAGTERTVQYLAGHENRKVTMDIYAKVKYNKPWELAKVVNAAFSEPQNNTDSEP